MRSKSIDSFKNWIIHFAFLVWAAYIAFQYVNSELYKRLKIDLSSSVLQVLTSLLIFLSMAGIGWAILSRSKISRKDIFEAIAYSGAAGLCFFATVFLILSSLGHLTESVSWGFVILGVGAGIPYFHSIVNQIIDRVNAAKQLSLIELGCLSIIGLHLLLIFVVCLAPSLAGDAVCDHLAVTKLIAQNGSLSLEPFAVDKGYANLSLFIKLPAFIIKGGILAQLVNGPIVSIFIIFAFYAVLRSLLPRSYCLFVISIFFSNPELIFANYKAGYHLTWYLFEILFIGTLAQSIYRKTLPNPARFGYLKWSAFFGALGFWSYYCMGFNLLILSLLLPYLLKRYFELESRNILFFCLSYAGIGITFALPLFFGNYLTTGNPLYPLLNDFWGSESRRFFVGGSNPDHIIGGITILWDMIFGILPNSGIKHPSPVLFLLIPFGLFFRRWPKNWQIPLIFIFTSYVAWFSMMPSSRHFIPVGTVLTVFFCYILWKASEKYKHLAHSVFCFAFFLFSLNLIDQSAYYLQNSHRWKYVLGQESEASYLDWGLKSAGAFPTWKITQYINHQTSKNARIFALHFQGFYFLDRPYLSIYQVRGEHLLNIHDEDKLINALKKNSFTHVLINQAIVDRLFVYSHAYIEQLRLSVKNTIILSEQFQRKYLKLVCEDGNDLLFEIVYA